MADQKPQDTQVPVTSSDQSADLSGEALAKSDSANTSGSPQSATTDNWPNSFTQHEVVGTNPAISDRNSSDSAISTDLPLEVPPAPVAPPVGETPPDAPSADSNQQSAEASQPVSDPDRPESTISANSDQQVSDSANLNQAPSTQVSPSDSAISPNKPVSDNQPEPPVSADSSSSSQTDQSVQLDQSPSPATASASAGAPPPNPPDPSTSQPSDSRTPGDSSSPPSVTPVETLPSQSIKPESTVSDTIISVPSSPDQAPQVQQETPNDTSKNEVPHPTEKLAEIKPEPLQSPTIPSTPPPETPPPSPSVSFGDLLSSENQAPSTLSIPPIPSAPSAPSTPSPSPTISFGDLIKDIKPEDSVIPPPATPSVPPISSPTITLSPGIPPIIDNPPPISSSSPSPLSPISPSSDTEDTDQKLKEALSFRRQKANLVRKKKKEEMKNKLVELVSSRGKITNREAQLLLHLPQSTLTDYFKELVNSGRLKIFGKKRGIYYTV